MINSREASQLIAKATMTSRVFEFELKDPSPLQMDALRQLSVKYCGYAVRTIGRDANVLCGVVAYPNSKRLRDGAMAQPDIPGMLFWPASAANGACLISYLSNFPTFVEYGRRPLTLSQRSAVGGNTKAFYRALEDFVEESEM